MNKKILGTVLLVGIAYILIFIRLPKVDAEKSLYFTQCVQSSGIVEAESINLYGGFTGKFVETQGDKLVIVNSPDLDVISKLICSEGIPSNPSSEALRARPDYDALLRAAPNYTVVLGDKKFTPSWVAFVGQIIGLIFVVLIARVVGGVVFSK